MTTNKSKVLLPVWLLVVALVSAGITYGQGCYSTLGSNWQWAWWCQGFWDYECTQYGTGVYCQEDYCAVSGCGAGYARRCVNEWDICYYHYCGGQQCV